MSLGSGVEKIPRYTIASRKLMSLTILYAAIPNSLSTNFIWATVSPFATRLALPFLIISVASIPVGRGLAPLFRRSGLSVAPCFRWECLTSRTVNGIPVPAPSHVACGFPALRAPADFASRVMGPDRVGRRQHRNIDTRRDTPRRALTCHTSIPCSTASTQGLDAGTLWPDGAVSSFPPSFE